MSEQASGFDWRGFLQRYGLVMIVVAVCIFFAVMNPIFVRPNNWLNILENAAIPLLMALGMMVVITSGGIDLSVGISLDIAALVAVVSLIAGVPWLLVLPLALLGSAVVGLINSLLIVRIGISPFLATLGMLFIGQSFQRIYTQGGEPIRFRNMPEGYKFLGLGEIWGVPFEIFIVSAAALFYFLFVEKTVHGRRIRAIGLQSASAKIAGLRVNAYKTLTYIMTAVTCGVAGIILSSSGRIYVPISGNAYLLDAIGAVFIGTALDRQARPNVIGTIIGVVFIAIIANGLNLMGISFYWKNTFKGLFILLALVIGQLNRRRL